MVMDQTFVVVFNGYNSEHLDMCKIGKSQIKFIKCFRFIY